MDVDLMSSLFKYLGQTARVKNRFDQRADQTLQSKKTHYLSSLLSFLSSLLSLLSRWRKTSAVKGRVRERTTLATEIISVVREGEEREKGARGKRRAPETGRVILMKEAISVVRRPEEREKNIGRKRERERDARARKKGERRRECGERKRRVFLLAPLLATEKFPSREREGKRENWEETRAQRKESEGEGSYLREREKERK